MDSQEWKSRKRTDGSYDLVAIYIDLYGSDPQHVYDYLKEIERLRPIVSRQVAATAIATARFVISGRIL